MKIEFLPVPKVLTTGAGTFRLHDGLNVFVNKAKVQDHVIDLFGFLWRNFKVNLKIVAIRDRDFKDEYENGFFLYITAEEALDEPFPGMVTAALARCRGEGYQLQVQPSSLLICSPTTRGFYNGVIALQQASDAFGVGKNPKTGRVELAVPEMDVQDHPDIGLRAVHVDLKRQMHSIDYLKDYIRLLARFKVNAVVWEWEDKFPFKRRPEIKHPLAFNGQEATELIELCLAHGVEAIPLVQTYGHLEFVLKKDQYAHLKEDGTASYDPDHTLDLCAMQDEGMRLIEDMIADVVSYHHRSRYIHIGGDEVYSIGTCERCKAYVDEHGHGDASAGRSKLYTMHMNRVIGVVKGFGKIPMLWHDYLLKYPDCIDELDKDAVVVYWMYGKDKSPADFAEEIDFFKKKGFKVLVASSVNSDFQYAIPNYDLRLRNIYELNKALVHDAAGNIGALATNWAGCRAPMETSVPAILFFADASWNVRTAPYSDEVLHGFSPRLLRRLFSLPDDEIPQHTRAIELLVESTSNPNRAPDLARIDGLLGEAIDAWKQLADEVRSGKSVAENIVHGLRLQRLKVHLFQLSRQLERVFDVDDPPRMKGVQSIESDVKALAKEFESSRIQTRRVYETVMYNEEVVDELEIRFKKPISYLERLSSSLASIKERLEGFNAMLVSMAPILRDMKGQAAIEDLGRRYDAISKGLQGYLEGTSPLPGIDSLVGYSTSLERAMPEMPTPVAGGFKGLLGAVKELVAEMDSFLLEVARNAMDTSFLGRF
ncbi:MAG: family 20 glycosylhydrolase [Candidatus Lokiarchaeota archaeon]|nr:family 20 glycosylhydrolase [Candidatus Lokiarchaeota archaeon]